MLPKPLVSSLIATLLIFSSTLQPLHAQGSARTDQEQQEARKEIERKAFDLLEEVATEARTLKRAESRIRIQAVSADLLWTRDQTRARSLFKEAMHNLGEIMSNIEPSEPDYYNLVQEPAQLRQEILQMIASRDAQLALEFLRATRQPPAPQTDAGNKPPDNELQMELNLATQIVADDSKLALDIAEKSLSRGFSYTLPSLLSQILATDREGGRRLANAIIQKLRSENLLTNSETASVAVQLLGVLNPATTTESAHEQGVAVNTERVIDVETYQELMNMVLTAALNASLVGDSSRETERNIAQTLLAALEPMIPQVERYAPQRVPALRRKIADYKRSLDTRTRLMNDYQELMNNGTPEALIEAAQNAPAQVRDDLYRQASWKAINQGDYDRARQIINDNISNPYQRKQMLANLDQQIFWQSANQGKFDEARQILSRLRSSEEQVSMLIQLANAASGKNDKRSALQFLEEAQGLLSRAENPGQSKLQLLQIAEAYVLIEPERSFDILEVLAGQINEYISAAEVLNGLEQQYFKDGEFVFQGTNLGNMVNQHAATLSSLADLDFDRARAVASRFQRNEVRIMARLSIAQGALNSQPEAARSLPKNMIYSYARIKHRVIID